MALLSSGSVLGFVLLVARQVLSYEVCTDDTVVTYYCNDGYHCCDDDSSCCSDGLGIGAWAGIIIAIIVFKSILICSCIRMCRRNRTPTTVVIRQPIIRTTTGPPPYSSLGNQRYQQTTVGYQTLPKQSPGYQQGTKTAASGPPPPYNAS